MQFSVLCSKILFSIHSVYKSLHLLTPASHATPPLAPSSLAATSLFSEFVILFLFHR